MISQPVLLDSLQFADSAGCARWVATLPLTNISSAQRQLTGQIALAGQANLPATELLKILETLREPVVQLQREAAVKYAGKPLPLENSELVAWKTTVALWQELTRAYLACRDGWSGEPAGRRVHATLVTLRCLQYVGRTMLEYYRIRHQPPSALWRQLNQLYAFAEQSGFAGAPTDAESGRREPVASCTAAFCRTLLIQLANPFALTSRQLDFVDRWSEGWTPLVDLSKQPPSTPSTSPLTVDIAGDHGAMPAGEMKPASGLRHLDLDPLARTLRQLITLLKQGQSPAQLGLGNEARQPGCENLLMLLYIQWCRSGTSRGEQRSTSEEKVQVCLGMHAVHFHVGGSRAFRPPGSSLSRQEEQDLQLFGRISERTERLLASGDNVAVESWQLVNHSGAGFMCMLREQDARARISHNQLVAVRQNGHTSFHVGVVQWLRAEENEELFIGVRLLASHARAVAVRPVNFKLPGIHAFERALLLPASSAPEMPATLILPLGWHQAGRFVDIHGEQKQVAKLDGLLEKGSDFDRCIVLLS
ncbi:MAG TPA: hypothetical protein VMT94_03655 [Burkholderiales bacterium]|nr:hypothetical protein [Burkholderiales bacterium]